MATEITDQDYDIEDPQWPLPDHRLDRFMARDLIDWALDMAGVPKRTDDGAVIVGRPFRVTWLLNACKEAEASG